MQVSFVVGFHTARMDNLLQTLRFLHKNHSEVTENAQLVTVCQDTCEHLASSVRDEFESLRLRFKLAGHFDMDLDCMMLPVVTNFGIGQCVSDKVIVLESDRILPPGYFSNLIEQMQKGLSITCRRMQKLLKPATDEEIEAGAFEYKDEYRSDENQVGVRNMWSGNTAIWRPDFYLAGEMDEGYIGYGWADSDMTNKMAEIGVQPVFREEVELHLWHPPATYGKGDQKQMFIDNGLRFCRKWGVTLPNWLREEISAHRKILL